MFGAGFVMDMIQTLKNNRRDHKTLFDKDVDIHYPKYGKIVDYKKMSPAQFEAFKQKLKENELRRQKHLAVVFGSILLVIICALIYFLFYH
jgi:hypothetical protein